MSPRLAATLSLLLAAALYAVGFTHSAWWPLAGGTAALAYAAWWHTT